MRFFFLEPEVAGGLGIDTVMDRRIHPPRVLRLHYELEGWLGDELLETFPCFVVTKQLGKRIEDSRLTGCELASVTITTTDQFRRMYPNRTVPEFVWLKITGQAGHDDFGLAQDYRLVVSERALGILQTAGLRNCIVSGCLM